MGIAAIGEGPPLASGCVCGVGRSLMHVIKVIRLRSGLSDLFRQFKVHTKSVEQCAPY